MTADDSLQAHGLVPTDASLPAIRQILDGEAANERNGHPREDDPALLCCVQLFSRGLLEDVLRIWAAKCSGMDLDSYRDVQFLCGAGLEETKHFLAAQPSKEEADALERLRQCEAGGEFASFAPESHLEQYRQYFGVA